MKYYAISGARAAAFFGTALCAGAFAAPGGQLIQSGIGGILLGLGAVFGWQDDY
jgi:hypothetical protein